MKLGLTSLSPRLSSLERTSAAISRSLNRLGSGSRLTEPREDAAAFSMVTSLEAQMRGLGVASRALNQTLSLLTTADSALSSQMDLVQRMREIAVEASSGTLNASNRANLNSELQGLLSEFERIGRETTFNDQNLLDGSFGTVSLNAGLNPRDEIDFSLDGSRGVDVFERTQGTGAFSLASTRSHSNTFNPANVEMADINNDGNLDMILPNWSQTTISIMLGNGDGTFQAETTLGGVYANSVAIDDFDGDGNLDIVAQTYTSTTLSVFRGRGDGTFEGARTYGIGLNSSSVYAGDVDDDGDADILSMSLSTAYLEILLNDGRGVFTSSRSIAIDANAIDLAISDINQDGHTDLVYGSGSLVTAAIYYGQGNAVFSSPTNVTFGAGGNYSLEVGDFNEDGINDIVQGSNTQVRLALGNASGGFGTATKIADGSTVVNLRMEDMDRDGHLDLVWGNYGTNNVSILTGQGNGSFNAVQTLTRGSGAVAVGDLNDDGVLDIVSRYNATPTETSVYLQATEQVLALTDITVASEDLAQNLIGILDTALENLTSRRSEIAALHSRLDFTMSSNLILSENLTEAKARASDLDIAFETAELVRLQILQQAQIAVQAQANSNLQVVLGLLSGL